MNLIPSYKNHYKSSIGALYRPLQDIEIYVEDKDSEVFYNQLFGRLLENTLKIRKVISLGCRDQVIKGALEQSKDSPKAFIIDGDLYLPTRTFTNEIPRLFQLEFYCIENALFCKEAAKKIIQETKGNIKLEDIETDLLWDDWYESISTPLYNLFIIFACAFSLKPEIKTVSRGISSVIVAKKKCPPTLDESKISKIISEVMSELEKSFERDVIIKEIERIKSNSKSLGINIVSGKNFLLPLMSFKIKEKCGIDMTTSSRNFRLAKHCNLESLEPLREFIIKQAGIAAA